jgi:hypothetical protein
MLCNVCLSSRGAQDIIDDKPQFSRPFLVAWDLRCFGTADAMSGCNETAPAHLLDARRSNNCAIIWCERLCEVALKATEMPRHHRGGRSNL